MACARFVANEIGVAGRTNLEQAQVDEIIDCIQELFSKKAALFFAKDDEGLKDYMAVTIPTALGQLEKRLEARGGQFMVGDSFTFADLHLFNYFGEFADKNILDGFPKIKNLTDRVGNIPNIKAWLESRPVTIR
eukprot:TRINITY_DN19037_c0_g1_i1.p1 TRINITY_DN19037_c0_g1~~TRINITY_DN19037_c0_g1_i1.p1  ORF type:complete len:155 (-),score=53.02 TRINITY_DN19037_c0_g1_i1:38-439(-)